MSRQECLWISQSSIPSPTRLSSIAAPPLVPTSAILTKEGGSTSIKFQKRRRNSIFRTETFNARQAVKLNNDLSYFLCPLDHYGIMKQYEKHAVLLFHMSGIFLQYFWRYLFCGISGGIFFGGISGGIFAVFLVFLQYRYGTETTVCHVSNTEYRYCIKIGYTAMHCRSGSFTLGSSTWLDSASWRSPARQ